MKRIEVHKFGGASLADADMMKRAAAVVAGASSGSRVIAVASAMSGATELLKEAARMAEAGMGGEFFDRIAAVHARHDEALDSLAQGRRVTEVREAIRSMAEDLRQLLRGVMLLGELSPRTLDRILSYGEKLSARLLAEALLTEGLKPKVMDADTFIETDGRFGRASPLAGVADRTTAGKILPLLEAGELPVITGQCGRGPDGATTTLGSGGSDLTATLVASVVGASMVHVWTDVEGIFSADPAVVKEARVLRQLNYREAAELSYYGARVLHQRSLIPAAARGIPVRVCSILDPGCDGTVVDGAMTAGSHPVKAVSAVRSQHLLSVEGKGMAGVPGVAARVFRCLSDRNISVTMISQSSSESSICMAVPSEDSDAAESALKHEFRADITRGDIEEIVVLRHVGLVAAVGLGMARTPGVAGRLFTALGRRKVNVLAIAQGSSELNISFAVDMGDVDEAVRAVHEEFGLHGVGEAG